MPLPDEHRLSVTNCFRESWIREKKLLLSGWVCCMDKARIEKELTILARWQVGFPSNDPDVAIAQRMWEDELLANLEKLRLPPRLP
jgi:hypothetical protein